MCRATAGAASPKYLLGESYGGFRAAKVAHALQHDQGIVVSGIVMVSPLIEGGYVFGGGDRYSLGCALQLPSIVAAELERNGRLHAAGDRRGRALCDAPNTSRPWRDRRRRARRRRAFYGRVAQMTGLPPELVARARGCVRSA